MVSPRVRDDLATKPHKPRWFLGVPLSPFGSSLSFTCLPRMTAPVGTRGCLDPKSLRQVGVRSLSPISPSEGDIIVAFHGAQFTYFSLVEPPSLPPQRERSLWVQGRERTAQAWPGRGQTEQLVLQLPAVSQLPAGLDIPETTCQRDSGHPSPSSGTLPRWQRPEQPWGCLLSPSSG